MYILFSMCNVMHKNALGITNDFELAQLDKQKLKIRFNAKSSDNIKKKLENAKKVAVIGIGSELRSDDAAGLLVAEKLQK